MEPLPEIDRSLVGKVFERATSDPVTTEQIVRYAKACGETEARYLEPSADMTAPPTFAVTLARKHFMPTEIPKKVIYRGMDAGKDIEIGAPVRPGDVMAGVSTIHDMYEKTGRSGKLVFLVFRTVVTNQQSETVATIDQRMMFR
jgi:acyl dehydratase